MDRSQRRPHRPLISEESVLLAVDLGANCQCKLAAVFDVALIQPDLMIAVNNLLTSGDIRAAAFKHTAPGGWTCTPIKLGESGEGAR